MSDETIKIRVTTPGGFLHKGRKYSEGDEVTEDFSEGNYFIQAGWAEDVTGKVTYPKPWINDVILYPSYISQNQE